jgi:hypothetical protein
MKEKLLQVVDFLKAAALWSFKIALKIAKAIVEESISLLQKLDTVLSKETSV